MTRVAAVIVNLDGGELLPRALEALRRQTLAPARVLVVDNGSGDGSADRLEERFPGVEVLRLGRNAGFAAANNLAVRAAGDCDWVALVNPDAFPEPDWLERLLDAAARRPEFTFFASRLLRAGAPETLDGAGDCYHGGGLAWRRHHGRPASGTALAEEDVFSPCAAAALYRRDAFLAAGGLDEDFFCYFEDVDLAFRLRLAGHRCLYVPDAVAHHVGSAISGAESDFTVYHSFRNLTWTWAKNMPGRLVLRYAGLLVLTNLLLLAAFALRGRPRVILRAQRDALRGLPRVLRQRRALGPGRAPGAGAILPALERGPAGYATTFASRAGRLFARRRASRPPAPDAGGVVVARNVASSFAAQAWLLALGLAATPYLVRSLGVEGFGLYALVLTLVGYFAFLDLGLGVATVKYVAELTARGDAPGVERVVRTALGAYLLLGGVGGAAVALSSSLVAEALLGGGDLARTALLVAAAGFAVNMPAAVLGAVPTALQRIALANAVTVGSATLGTGGAVLALALGHGLIGALVASLAAGAVSLVAFACVARRLLPRASLRPGFDRSSLRLLARFGSLKFANQLAVQTIHHLDKLLVAAFLSVAAVTFYAIPVAVAQRVAALVANVTVPFFSAASALHGAGDRGRFAELYLRAGKAVALVALPAGLVLAAFATPLLTVWIGPEVAAESAWPLRLLAAGFALGALGTIPAVACDAVGRPGVTTAFSVAGAALNVALSLVFIPLWGILGAAAVNLVQSALVLPVFLAVAHRRVLGVPLGAYLARSLARPAAAAALALAPTLLLASRADGFASLAGGLAASLALFAAAALAVGASDAADRTVALAAFRRRAEAAT